MVCQAFPPLLKNAGGVAKRYLTLCEALIDVLGWHVVLMTPVNVSRSLDKRVERWLREGNLTHIPARGVRVDTKDGVAMFLDLFSWVNAAWLLHILMQHPWRYDVCITDDVPWRINLMMLMRAFNVPTITTSHTDATRLEQSGDLGFKVAWRAHMASARWADVHASVSNVFGDILRKRENAPVNAIWPPILWSDIFREDPEKHTVAAKAFREMCMDKLGWQPRALMLYVGRWASEKRIHLLAAAVPEDCALVIVGDGTSAYADEVMRLKGKNVMCMRGMMKAPELRVAYQAADLFVSASDFETLGNTVVESLCSGTVVAVQPAQGHLEYVEDGRNSYFVDYDDPKKAKAKLSQIVESGLKPGALPQFHALSNRLRQSNFAQEFRDNVLSKALDSASSRVERRCAFLIEPLARVMMFVLWLLMWIVMRTVTRAVFFFSVFPKFQVLGQLGMSVEQGMEPTPHDITPKPTPKVVFSSRGA